MKIVRRNQILLGALVIQLVLAVIVLTRGESKVSLKEEPVLAGFDPATVSHLVIYADGNSKPAVDLVKRPSGWALASQFDYPVDAAKVTAALAPLAKMTAGEPIATSATHHKQLRVADTEFERKIVVSAGGKDTTLFLGENRQRRTALRFAGEEQVLAATAVSTTALSSVARDWVARDYVAIPRDDIDRIQIQRGATAIDLDRTAGAGSGSGSAAPARTWRIAIDGKPVVLDKGESIDDFAIDTIVSTVSTIDADPADPKRDASKPDATITITSKGKEVVLDVVADGSQYYWIKQRGDGRATRVDKQRMESVMTYDRARLIKKPAPAGSGSGSGSASPMPQLPGIPGLE